MNIASVELLNNALQYSGDAALKRRALQQQQQQEMARIAMQQQMEQVAQSRYDSQQAHYNTIEKSNSDRADAATSSEALKDKQTTLQQIMSLNSTGQLTDDSRAAVNKWLLADPHFGSTGLQIAAPSNNVGANPKAQNSAVVNSVNAIKDFRDKASSADNPDEAAQYNHLADLIEQNLPANAKAATPPPMDEDTITTHHPATPDTQDVKQVSPGQPGVHNLIFPDVPPVPPTFKTNTIAGSPAWDEVIKKHIASGGSIVAPPSPAAPSSTTPASPSATIPNVMSQDDYDAVPVGSSYKDANGNVRIKKGLAQPAVPVGGAQLSMPDDSGQ